MVNIILILIALSPKYCLENVENSISKHLNFMPPPGSSRLRHSKNRLPPTFPVGTSTSILIDSTGFTSHWIVTDLLCTWWMLYLFCFFSDRTIPNLDTLVPFDSTKAYDILDVIYPVSNKDCTAAQCACSKSLYWLQYLSCYFQVLRILLIDWT